MSELIPLKNDAVLGGQNPAPVAAAVLGGWTGLQRKLELDLKLPLQISSFKTCKIDETDQIILQPKEALYYTEDLGNGVTLDMVYVSGGEFPMGSPAGEGNDSERPQHRVRLASFYMGMYPITELQYQAISGENIRRFRGDKYPLADISWDAANRLCKKLSQKTGRLYTFPSESQWEYGCRAKSTTTFYCGDIITPAVANYCPDLDSFHNMSRSEVGAFPPNAFGLYDLHGNVSEWCLDTWIDSYDATPSDGTSWQQGGYHTYRVLRGGSCFNKSSDCRSASRHSSCPHRTGGVFGLRVVSPIL
jgi:formylglycine-generating enzyme required for sulfatase activity